jgi:hypothetical protein
VKVSEDGFIEVNGVPLRGGRRTKEKHLRSMNLAIVLVDEGCSFLLATILLLNALYTLFPVKTIIRKIRWESLI